MKTALDCGPVASGLAIMWHLDRLFGRAFEAADGDARLRSASPWEALLRAPDWQSFLPSSPQSSPPLALATPTLKATADATPALR